LNEYIILTPFIKALNYKSDLEMFTCQFELIPVLPVLHFLDAVQL